MTPIEIIDGVLDLFTKPNAWTREAFSTDGHGVSVWPRDFKAKCWCLAGAFDKVSDQPYFTEPLCDNELTAVTEPIADAAAAVRTSILEMFPDRGSDRDETSDLLPVFNDNVETTIDDVRAVLVAAKEKLAI